MLILDTQKVSNCRVSSKKHPAGFAGVEYRDLVFVKARVFPAAEKDKAVRLCQETLDAGRLCILLKDMKRAQYSICYQVKPTSRLAAATPASAPAPKAKAKPAPRSAAPMPQAQPKPGKVMANANATTARPVSAEELRRLTRNDRENSRTIFHRALTKIASIGQ